MTNLGPYDHIEIVVVCLSLSFRCLVITSWGGGVTSWKLVRFVLLCILYLPVPTRSRSEGVRPKCFSPEVFKKKHS